MSVAHARNHGGATMLAIAAGILLLGVINLRLMAIAALVLALSIFARAAFKMLK